MLTLKKNNHMKAEIVIAGFGGQGVLSMGKTLAYSGLMEDKEVTWLPSYGPEQRGGTANVTVILSSDRISSPTLDAYDMAVVLNQQSLDKFQDKVKPGGVLIYDSYGIHTPPTRTDINVYRIDATEAAKRIKFNMGVSENYFMEIAKFRAARLLWAQIVPLAPAAPQRGSTQERYDTD